MKAFKYFDLNDNGQVEPDEFAKAIEKIGIQIPTQKVSPLFRFKCAFSRPQISLNLYLLNYIQRISILILFVFKQDLDTLFGLYDTDNSGGLSYKEFSAALFNKGSSGGSQGMSAGPTGSATNRNPE